MDGAYYRYHCPKLWEIQIKGLEELTPLHSFFPKERLFYSKAQALFFDMSLIYSFLMLTALLYTQTQTQALGAYFQASHHGVNIPLILSLTPTLGFLCVIFYYSMSYFFNQGGTLGNHWYGTQVIPFEYFQKGSEKNFELSKEQSLKRAVAHSLNFIFFYTPNLISLIDPYHRGFPDLFSRTISVSKKNFYQSWESKGTPEYQLMVDIEKLPHKATLLPLKKAA